ncbi:MAG: DUF6194 family protein [Nakamurella multipartita]
MKHDPGPAACRDPKKAVSWSSFSTGQREHLEISWSDHFFYYAPDGLVPRNRQPYATIVTKNYPDDVQSRLDDPDRWRLNIHVGPQWPADLVGYPPEEINASAVDFGAPTSSCPTPSTAPTAGWRWSTPAHGRPRAWWPPYGTHTSPTGSG